MKSSPLPDVVAFITGLALAATLGWETRDLVWSLWLASLVTGTTTLLSASLAEIRTPWASADHMRNPGTRPHPLSKGGVLATAVGGLLIVVFFSFHFGGFHAVHSVFLNQFFPLEGIPPMAFGEGFINPLRLWGMALEHLGPRYGLFLLPVLIAERHAWMRPWTRHATQARASQTATDNSAATPANPWGWEPAGPVAAMMTRPYLNVIRMHLLIFFFAFSHLIRIPSFAVYTTVYAVYFLPWRSALEHLRRARD